MVNTMLSWNFTCLPLPPFSYNVRPVGTKTVLFVSASLIQNLAVTCINRDSKAVSCVSGCMKLISPHTC